MCCEVVPRIAKCWYITMALQPTLMHACMHAQLIHNPLETNRTELCLTLSDLRGYIILHCTIYTVHAVVFKIEHNKLVIDMSLTIVSVIRNS